MVNNKVGDFSFGPSAGSEVMAILGGPTKTAEPPDSSGRPVAKKNPRPNVNPGSK